VSAAGLACFRPGFRTRLICRYHQYRGRKGEKKAFTWPEYRDLVTAAHRQLPGGKIVLVWDNLNTHAQAEKLALNGRPWLRICRLPSYAPTSTPSRASGPSSSAARSPTSPAPPSATSSGSSGAGCGQSSAGHASSKAASPKPASPWRAHEQPADTTL